MPNRVGLKGRPIDQHHHVQQISQDTNQMPFSIVNLRAYHESAWHATACRSANFRIE